VVGNAALFVWSNLVGSDVEAAIDGGRIAGDDLPTEPARDCNRERALSGGRRADDRNEQRTRQDQNRRATA
jgi:hypothetical protein